MMSGSVPFGSCLRLRGVGVGLFVPYTAPSSPEPFCSKMDSDGNYSRVTVVTIL